MAAHPQPQLCLTNAPSPAQRFIFLVEGHSRDSVLDRPLGTSTDQSRCSGTTGNWLGTWVLLIYWLAHGAVPVIDRHLGSSATWHIFTTYQERRKRRKSITGIIWDFLVLCLFFGGGFFVYLFCFVCLLLLIIFVVILSLNYKASLPCSVWLFVALPPW